MVISFGNDCSQTKLDFRSGDGRRDGRFWLKDIVKDTFELPSPDAKSDFYNIRCSVMKVDPEQMPFFYPADIATGKKVIVFWSQAYNPKTSSLKFISNRRCFILNLIQFQRT